jgi:hypothetical protein
VHRFDDHRHIEVQLAHPGHAHQLRHSIHLSRARAALACFAIPPNRKIGGELGLDAMDRVEHDHALVYFRLEILECSPVGIAAPDSKHYLFRHLFHFLDDVLQLRR